MIDTLSLLIAEAAFIVTVLVGFFKFILPMSEKITRIDTNTSNLVAKQKEDIERIDDKVDKVINVVKDHESRLDKLESKVL